jgi:hypothetical protein
MVTRSRWLVIGLSLGLGVGAALTARAQDTTSLLSAFLVNLRASHLIPGSGGAVPVVSVCGDGALQTGSNDTVGRVVGTTQTACTVTFGGAFGANAADCVIANITANRGNVSAASTAAFTVSNLTAGDDFIYLCAGR